MTILLIILILALLFGGGSWGWANRATYGPAPLGIVTILAIVLLVLLLSGYRL